MTTEPELTSEDAEAIRAYLVGIGHPQHLVCAEGCRFVIEGYPESGNTLVADLLHLLNPGLRFAHQTHHPLNMRLGALQKIPRMVLLRRPFDAITAFAAASADHLTVAECVRRYVDFHRSVARMQDVLVAEYALLMEDPNAIIARLNERLRDAPLAFSADVRGDGERARERRRERVAAAGQTEPSPAERESAEAKAAEEVRAILLREDAAEAVYALILSRGG